MNEEWIGKKCKIFIKNLSDKLIIYTGDIVSANEQFITIHDKADLIISVNVNDVVQIKEEKEIIGDGYRLGM